MHRALPPWWPTRRIRPQLQQQASECAQACLGMVADFHGLTMSLDEIRQHVPVSARGTSALQLIRAADSLGLSARALRLEPSDVAKLRMPAILHWNLAHFVVLECVKRGGVHIVDPATGPRRVGPAELDASFTGVALELQPTSRLRPKAHEPTLRLRRFLADAPGLARQLGSVLLLSVSLQLIALLMPFFSQWVIDDIVLTGDTDLLRVLALAFIALALLNGVIAATRGWVVVWIGALLNFRWTTGLFRHLLRVPLEYFERRQIGDIQSRFGSLTPVRELITTQSVEILVDGAMAATIVLVLLAYDPGLSAVVLAAVLAEAALRASLLRPLQLRTLQVVRRRAEVETLLLETLRGIAPIKNYLLEPGRQSEYEQRTSNAVAAEAALAQLTVAERTASQMLFAVQNIAVLWLGAERVIAGSMTVGMLVAFVAYQTRFSLSAAALVDRLIRFRLIRAHLERLSDLAGHAEETYDRQGCRMDSAASPALAVAVERLGFRYSAAEPFVLENLNFKIPAGRSIALVAPSGFGKTTLLKLLAGLLMPTQGSVLVGDRPLTVQSVQAHRSRVGLVMQDDQLFAGSVARNIALFEERPDMQRVRYVASLASVDAEIEAMPMSYHTLIGDMGSILSGGQKQRVLLARALYRTPGLLLLDEATSHLDADNERRVCDAIAGLGITRVHVAHRQSTIERCDFVLRLVRDSAQLALNDTALSSSPLA